MSWKLWEPRRFGIICPPQVLRRRDTTTRMVVKGVIKENQRKVLCIYGRGFLGVMNEGLCLFAFALELLVLEVTSQVNEMATQEVETLRLSRRFLERQKSMIHVHALLIS